MIAEILTISVAAMPVVAEIFGLGTAFVERNKPQPVTENHFYVGQPDPKPLRIEITEPMEPAPVPLMPLVEETP